MDSVTRAVTETADTLQRLVEAGRIHAAGRAASGWFTEDDAWQEAALPGLYRWSYDTLGATAGKLAEALLVTLGHHTTAPTASRASWSGWCPLHGRLLCPTVQEILDIIGQFPQEAP